MSQTAARGGRRRMEFLAGCGIQFEAEGLMQEMPDGQEMRYGNAACDCAWFRSVQTDQKVLALKGRSLPGRTPGVEGMAAVA
jgi:hypothetical protein